MTLHLLISKFFLRSFTMPVSDLRIRTMSWFLFVATSVAVAACGGSKDPILGLEEGAALAPNVSATAPLAQSPAISGVPLNSVVTATFNKAMNPETLNASTFTLACPEGQAVTANVSYLVGSRVATLTPEGNLPQSTRCVATISTGAQDTSGLPLASAFVWAFDTGAALDATPPTVTSQVPAQDAVANANTLVTATFSEDMAPDSLNTSSFTLKTTVGDVPVVGTVSYAVGARTATFTPSNPSPLPSNTAFTATLSTGATDLAGNPMSLDKVWTFTTSEVLDTTPPEVTVVNPALDAAGVCLNKTVHATFSEPMDPLSLTSSTLTLAPANSLDTPVLAVVNYDAETQMASLDPIANLAASTLYTATVVAGSLGVKDLSGHAMLVNKVWQFTTGTSECQEPLVLGAASHFAILASAAVTNIPTSAITGDVGLTPDTGANITGFSAPESCPEVVGRIYAVDGAGPACALADATLLSLAKTDALAAFVNATSSTRGTPTPIDTNLAGLTLYPGLYESGTSIDLSAAGAVTLDAQGDPNAVFVIRSATSITTLSTSQVVLSGGAKASRIFWTAGSAITLGANSVMKGSLLAGTAITLQTGANLQGRALNQGAAAAAISCDACTITLPMP
jgi:hypothetical protein